MPQWHLLNWLAEAAGRFPFFTLLRSHEVTDIVRDRGIVTAVPAVGQDGGVQVRAYLSTAADGRASVIRARPAAADLRRGDGRAAVPALPPLQRR